MFILGCEGKIKNNILMMKNKKTFRGIAIATMIMVVILAIFFFIENQPNTTQVIESTPLAPTSNTSVFSCEELENFIETEMDKLNYDCENDSDCTEGNIGWCGSCINKNTGDGAIKNLFNAYNTGVKEECLPQVECEKLECNRCENNRCVEG